MSETPHTLSDAQMLELLRSPKAMPTSAKLLGLNIVEVDGTAGRAVVDFVARPDFCNPIGTVQGGFLAAMLDDAMAIAAIVRAGLTIHIPTLELRISFLRPASPGPLRAIGEAVKLGRTTAYMEGSLFDRDNQLLARASATARPVPRQEETRLL